MTDDERVQLNIHTSDELKQEFRTVKSDLQDRYFWMNVSDEDALGYLIALYRDFEEKPIVEADYEPD